MTRIVFFITSIFLNISIFSQTKLVLDDKSGIINSLTDSLLQRKLAEHNIELVTMVDYRKKCEYLFSKLESSGDINLIEIKDCNDILIGQRDLGHTYPELNENERAIILSYIISDIIKNPEDNNYKELPEKDKEELKADNKKTLVENQHLTRHIFTPTAYNLQKGELYYNTMLLAVHDIQYGLTDDISVGMGTSIAGYPFYLTPKATIFNKENISVAVGDIFAVGTWGNFFIGNVAYGVVTVGNQFRNFSVGSGYLIVSGNIDKAINAPVFNASCMLKLSDYFYFITENYYCRYPEKLNSYVAGVSDYIRHNNAVLGITGIRFINRNKNIVSYQVGLAYLFLHKGEVPQAFQNIYYSNSGGGAIPMVSYTRKFGSKY